MSTITLPNIRVSSDLTVELKLKDGGVAIDWSTLSNIRVCIYSDVQHALAGRCTVAIDETDSTVLVCQYAANKPQYLGVNRVIVQASYMGETKTYDKPALNFVRWTDDQEGEEITITDPDIDVEIEVEDVSSSILQEAIDAALNAAADAEHAAHLIPNQVLLDCEQATADANEAAATANAAGIDQVTATVDANVGTPSVDVSLADKHLTLGFHNMKGVTGDAAGFGTVGATVDANVGTPAVSVSTSGPDTAKNISFAFSNLKGEKGDKGDQGNTGSSVDYPYELVNNLTTNDSTKGLSAAMGVQLEGEVSQLELKVDDFKKEVKTGQVTDYIYRQTVEVVQGVAKEVDFKISVKKGTFVRFHLEDTNSVLLNTRNIPIKDPSNNTLGYVSVQADKFYFVSANTAYFHLSFGSVAVLGTGSFDIVIENISDKAFSYQSFPLWDGRFDPTTNSFVANSGIKSTCVVKGTGEKAVISVKDGYAIRWWSWNGTSWINNGVLINASAPRVAVVSEAQSYVFDVVKKDTAFVAGEDPGLIISFQDYDISKMVSRIYTIESAPKFGNNLVPLLKVREFAESVTLSAPESTLAVSDGYDINAMGVMCVGYRHSENATSEQQPGIQWNNSLIICNTVNPTETKQIIPVFRYNTAYGCVDGRTIIVGQSYICIAQWTGDDEITIKSGATFRFSGQTEYPYSGFLFRKYKPSTGDMSNVYFGTIEVENETYPLYTGFEEDGTTVKDEYIANFEAIWEDTGIDHPAGYGGRSIYLFEWGCNPAKYDGYFYGVMCLGGFSTALCRSLNLIDWEYVCEVPFHQASEEVSLCFYSGRLYVTSRGNYSLDEQDSKVAYCPADNLVSNAFSTPIVLTGCRNERPEIVGCNSRIYVLQGYGVQYVYDGHNYARCKKALFVFDTDLALINKTDLNFYFPLLHPMIINHNGQLWSIISSDKRGFIGDSRSEISLAHIDPEILALSPTWIS